VIEDQHDDRSEHCNDQTVQIEAGDAAGADRRKDETADHRPDNAKNNVEKETLALFVHDLAGDESCNQPQYNPRYDRHDAPVRRDAFDLTGAERFWFNSGQRLLVPNRNMI
jgi:hypothetical protein